MEDGRIQGRDRGKEGRNGGRRGREVEGETTDELLSSKNRHSGNINILFIMKRGNIF